MKDILQKIKKLLILSERSTNEGESMNAMTKAQALMAKHGIENIEVGKQENDSPILEESIENQSKIIWWKKRMLWIIAKNFRCKSYLSYGHNFVHGNHEIHVKTEVRAIFLGRSRDVRIAHEIYRFAIQELVFHANQYMKNKRNESRKRSRIGMRNDYIVGFLKGLEKRFETQIQENKWQLIVVPDDAVISRFESKGLQEGRLNPISSARDDHAFESGFNDGHNCNLTQSKIEKR